MYSRQCCGPCGTKCREYHAKREKKHPTYTVRTYFSRWYMWCWIPFSQTRGRRFATGQTMEITGWLFLSPPLTNPAYLPQCLYTFADKQFSCVLTWGLSVDDFSCQCGCTIGPSVQSVLPVVLSVSIYNIIQVCQFFRFCFVWFLFVLFLSVSVHHLSFFSVYISPSSDCAFLWMSWFFLHISLSVWLAWALLNTNH